MMILQATTAVMKEGTMADHWFRGADLGPNSTVSAFWILFVMFIAVLIFGPKIKGLKERINGSTLLWLGAVIVLAALAYYYDVPRFIMSYIN